MLTPLQWAFIIFHSEQDHHEDIEVKKALIHYELGLHFRLRHDPKNLVHILREEPLEDDEPTSEDEDMQDISADPFFGLLGTDEMPLPPFLQDPAFNPFQGFGDRDDTTELSYSELPTFPIG